MREPVPQRELTALDDRPVPVPDPERLVHLQFRRFAGCPVCHLHLRSFVTRHAEIAAAGVREVVVFHSSAAELRAQAAELPFDVVPDPDKRLYREFDVGASPRALLDPRAWPAIGRGVAAAVRARRPAPRVSGGRLGLPADFLIAPDGRVLAGKHGRHADDQWSVAELLALVPARAARP